MEKVQPQLPEAAQQIVAELGLQHTSEGPYLKRFYQSGQEHDGRPAATSVHGIVAKNAPSMLHRLDCDELWHFYSGNSMQLYMFTENGLVVERLGNDLGRGEKPLVIVPKGTIFGAAVQNDDDWCWFGCTCVPGFKMQNCTFIKEGSEELLPFAHHKEIIAKLTAFQP